MRMVSDRDTDTLTAILHSFTGSEITRSKKR